MSQPSQWIIDFCNFIWGVPILVVLLGGGLFLLIYSGLIPFRYIPHAIKVLTGRYDKVDDPGQISHYQALSTALAATVGMGNISGVAVAITMGGPGAIYWMWVSAMLGVATKFFTCTLAVMFRGRDSAGTLQGGPMYFIVEGLGKKWKPLAVFFSTVGMFALIPIFQSNQLTQIIRDVILIPNNIHASFYSDLILGIIMAFLMAIVIFGGITRIGKVAGQLVPIMVIGYFVMVLVVIFSNVHELIPSMKLIFVDAFSGHSVMGGAVGSVIIIGVRRAAFSNEAGIGTAPMAHGAAKTTEPIREGLVAMLGPIIDTIIVCTLTALAILVSGVWQNTGVDGITLTAMAFNSAMPGYGPILLIICVSIFALTTMFTYPYYGDKCFIFLFGNKYSNHYKVFNILSVVVGAVASLTVVISFIDATYALMAFPTVISTVILAPKVKKAAKSYFFRMKEAKNIKSK